MKTVIITGASGFLGSAVTQKFLEKNNRVLATVNNESGKTALGSHPNLIVTPIDLTDEKAANEFVLQAIRDFKSIDAAMLLVGGFVSGSISETTGDDLRKQIALNFETAYFVTRPLFQHMKEKKQGNIVFVGARPVINHAQGKSLVAYSLSKSLLFKLAEYLNEETKGLKLNISVVVPSTLDTDVNRKAMPDADPENWVKTSTVAEILEFLVSDSSSALKETVLKIYNNA